MDSYSFKKDKVRVTKRYGLEVSIKTGCNVIVWCHVFLLLWLPNYIVMDYSSSIYTDST